LKEKKDNYEEELKKAEGVLRKLDIEKKKARGDYQKQYILPDGTKITMAKERVKAPEILFDTSIIGMEFPGLHDLVYQSIQLCNIDVKQSLYQNIILAGGTTLMSGLESRLKDELADLAPNSVKLGIVAPENRTYSSWLGGSVYAMMPNYHENVLTKEMYEESGLYHQKTWEKFLFN
jgi:actin-related protein